MQVEENETPQEIEQDDNQDIRDKYNELVEAEDKPIDDIEPKDPEVAEAAPEGDEAVEEVAEVVEEAIELPELTPNDLWPSDFKEKFPELPRDAQQFLIDTHRNMQTGLTQKFTELADQRRNVEAIEHAYQPLEQFARTNGMQTNQIAIQAAQHIQNIIQDPYPGARGFLKSMGVDINKLVEQEEYIDPATQAANQQNLQLQQRIQQMEQNQATQGQMAAQQKLNAFINETTEQGHLKHPRFEELKPTIAQFLQQDVQGGQPERELAEYYAMAERFISAQTPSLDPQKVQEPKANAVQKAKVASKNIKSKTNTKAPAQMSQREQIRQQYRQLKQG